MDIYGAFQFCSIGILAAPVTARLSTTYFENPGRNAIFLWTGLIFSGGLPMSTFKHPWKTLLLTNLFLPGLLSLTVEFFRIQTLNCADDHSGQPVSPQAKQFRYNTSCGLTCSVDHGPFSRIRGGSANNIYVIPAPDKLSFGTATLLAAACCIPAILSLVSMWNKILKISWESRFGDEDEDKRIDGTNGATVGKMKAINEKIKLYLGVSVEVPVYVGAVLAILVAGEMNFFSTQVNFQTEPITSIGSWPCFLLVSGFPRIANRSCCS